MIKVSNLDKFYNKNAANEIHVINNISLELPACGLVSFLGASGSGKTTLLNVIGGLDRAQGSISYDSFEMTKYDMSRIDKYRNENFGYVFQGYNLLPGETVYDNLKVALELIDIHDQDECASRIEYALKCVGMYKYRKKRASQLSGGQQQRVAIARALVKHCKVIIADEPTGNLDSANAVEVMNILKSISKKTLVLLVTHNESLAGFYSDYIYRIEDGAIVDGYENSDSTSLDTANDNVVYLKDMPVTECTDGGISVKLYGGEDTDISLEIVERNNTFYIRSNKNIKLVADSSIRLVDEHYKPVERTDIEKHDYDDSFFNNSVRKKSALRELLSGIRRSFTSFINPTKKLKAIYASLAMIGVLFAFCAITISNAVKVDERSISADASYSALYRGGSRYFYEDGNELRAALKRGAISSVQVVYSSYSEFSYRVNYVEEKKYNTSYYELYYNDKVNRLLYGTEPHGEDIAISLALADELLEEFSDSCNSYEDLFGLTVHFGDSRLVGIVAGDNRMAYMSKAEYVKRHTPYYSESDDMLRYYEIEKKYDSYEIVKGRDLTDEDLNTENILISDKYPGYEEALGTELAGFGNVVGVFRMKDTEYSTYEIITNIKYIDSPVSGYQYSYEVEDYHLVEGRAPERENECLISIYNSMNVGDYLDGYKVVGRYNASTRLLRANALVSTSTLSIDDYSKKVFVLEDRDALLSEISSSDFELKSMYENEYLEEWEENEQRMTVFTALGVICLIVASIMVFFLMRSKMINDIYNIGVYRSLGASRSKIYTRYFSDVTVMVTFTALISYIVVTVAYFTAIDSINEYWGMELFSKNPLIPIVGILILYAINLVFGLLPIFTLLRKTPSEILVKYDI